jgi:hypothetical protein
MPGSVLRVEKKKLFLIALPIILILVLGFVGFQITHIGGRAAQAAQTTTHEGGTVQTAYSITGVIRCVNYGIRGGTPPLNSEQSASSVPELSVDVKKGDGICLVFAFEDASSISNVTVSVPESFSLSDLPPPFGWQDGAIVNYSLVGTTVPGPATFRFVFGATAMGVFLANLTWNDHVMVRVQVKVSQ